jgi:hypothetical protein
MFIGRTPGNRRAAQRARQLQYAKALDAQVVQKADRKVEALARAHAERYTQEFGLADQLASKPGSGFGGAGAGLSPRFNPPHVVSAGQPPGAGARRLNDQITGELEERFRNITKAFLAADVNRSGSLDVSELRRLCAMYNLPTAKVEAAFAMSDIDGNGLISYSEFAQKLARVDYSQTSMPLPGAPGYEATRGSGRSRFPGKPGELGGMPRRFVNPALNGGQPQQQMQMMQQQQQMQNGSNNYNDKSNFTATYTGSLKNMWQGGRPGSDEVRMKRAQQNAYVSQLESQIAERKDRERKAKQMEADAERRADAEARRFNPWGRGGGGAPLQDERGRMITDLRDLHEVANMGGVSPKQGRNGGMDEDLGNIGADRMPATRCVIFFGTFPPHPPTPSS